LVATGTGRGAERKMDQRKGVAHLRMERSR
jgi:hypothetical protein